MTDSIPVLGTAIVNSTFWLTRLIGSVDYPVDNFVIIDNSKNKTIKKELNTLVKVPHRFIKNIVVSHMPGNIGCAGAWNLIIKSFLMSPYWIITNPDVMYMPGFLKEMVEKGKDSEVGMVHCQPTEVNVGSFEVFLLKDWVVQKIGLFDENLYPAYDEDCDYLMRIINDPFTRILSMDALFYHGDGNYLTDGSQTLKADPSLKKAVNDATYINEHEYMDLKWGKGWHWCEPYKHPFNNDKLPNTYTTYDLEFNRRKYTGF